MTENQRPELTATADPVSGTAPLEVELHRDARRTPTVTTRSPTLGLRRRRDVRRRPAATHTYTDAGTYTAKVTATDARGASGRPRRSRSIVAEEPDTCFNGRSDDFLGDTLDTDRWDAVVRANRTSRSPTAS